MARSIDHIVETHRLARERLNSGRPVWAETLDVAAVFRDESKTFTERRDAIVTAVKATRWWKRKNATDTEVEDAVFGLEQAEDADEFDQYWSELYDLADFARVWVKTR